jgi:hypothetical protein
LRSFYSIVKNHRRYTSAIVGWSLDRPKSIRTVEAVLAFAPLFFMLASTVIGIFRPGYSLLQDTISVLVAGRFGFILTSAFFVLAAAGLILVVRLLFRSGTSLKYKTGVGVLSLITASLISLGLNPTDLPGQAVSLTGFIHTGSTAAVILLFPVACFMIAPGLRTGFRSKWLSIYTRFTGITQLVLVAGIAVLVLQNLGWVGLAERMIMLNCLAWMQVTGLRSSLFS